MTLSLDHLHHQLRQAHTTVRRLQGARRSWMLDLERARSRVARSTINIGVLGHLPGDLALAVHALFGEPLLPAAADARAGRLTRIVPLSGDGEPELEEHAPDRDPWHWSNAHPDPVPRLRAQATRLQAERAALTHEDQEVASEAAELAKRVARLQGDVLSLTSAVGDAARKEAAAREVVEVAEKQLARARSGADAVRERLPGVLAQDDQPQGIRGLHAAVVASFHQATLADLDHHDSHVDAALAELQRARLAHEDADARAVDARARLAAHEERLTQARSALSQAKSRRERLRSRAAKLSSERLGLAQRMDHAAHERRATLTDDLAARLHGDPRGRLRLRRAAGALGPDVVVLVAPGTHAESEEVRRASESSVSERADAMILGARLADPPDPDGVAALRRVARSCPRVGLLFTDARGPSDPRRAPARAAWAAALNLPVNRVLAAAVTLPHPDDADDGEACRRECHALGLALQADPPAARTAAAARALRSTAQRLDAELRRIERHGVSQRALLDAQKIEDAEAFVAERLTVTARHVAPAAERVRDTVRAAAAHTLKTAGDSLCDAIRAAPDRAALDHLSAAAADRLDRAAMDARTAADRAVGPAMRRAVDDLVGIALEPLSERVRLAVHATRPPVTPERAPAPDADTTAVLDTLRAALNPAAARPGPALLAGGAIGAALMGPLGAVVGAGAGLLANHLGAGVERRRKAMVDIVEDTVAKAISEVSDPVVATLVDIEPTLTTALAAELPSTLRRYADWWHNQRAEQDSWARRTRAELQALAHARDTLVGQAADLEELLSIAAEGSSGVVVAPAYAASLPPPPPPPDDLSVTTPR